MNTYLWVALLFGITVTGYLMGYNPVFFDYMAKYNSTSYAAVPLSITSYVTSWDGLLTIGGSVLVGTLVGGLNLLVIVPFVLATLLINLFVLPTSVITQSGLPFEVQLIILVFLNVTTYLVLINFLRSGN